jgi:Hydrolytic ATP binding site of dynein motor region
MQVLLRALRDFNLGKLTSDDTLVFLGLLADLFPKTSNLVPRAVDLGFENTVRIGHRTPQFVPCLQGTSGAYTGNVLSSLR